jgi:type IV pilus biogenesis protein PilP
MANRVLLALTLSAVPLFAFAQGAPVPVPSAQPAPAAQPPAAAPDANLRIENVVIAKDEFTRMQKEILVLKKRLEETDLRAQITSKQKEIERLTAPPPAPDSGVIFKSMRQTVDGDRSASFILANGSRITAREGDTLPNGMRVSSIRSDAVVLRKGAVEKRVGVGGSSSAGTTPGAPSGGMPMGRPF